MSDEDRARLAVLGGMVFAFLEAMDISTVAKVNTLLTWQKDNFPTSSNPVFDECVKAEFDRFIAATEAIIS